MSVVLTVLTRTLLKVWQGFSIMATESKNARLLKKIGTHNGTFHCDEALACFMLKQLPEYSEADIIRTRDPSVLATCDIIVDVGGEYNPKTHRYDHHQRDFTHTLNSIQPDLSKNKFKEVKLSSAGLVFAHFGIEIISEILKQKELIELDAIDNGIPMYDEGKPKYKINTHLSARIGRLNPVWNSTEKNSMDTLFEKAMDIVGEEFIERVVSAVKVWWPCRQIVQKAIQNRKKVHETGEIILLEDFCPWKDHLMSLEVEMGIGGQLKFCIFQDKHDSSWRVQGIPIQPDSFICRVFLHKDWHGIRGEELVKVSGIDGCIFCHSTGFIGGNKTKEGAIEMALRSIQANGN